MKLARHEVECAAEQVLKGWHLEYSNGKIRMKYLCCALPQDQALGGCKDVTTPATTRSPSTHQLVKHNVACTLGLAMVSWRLVDLPSSGKMKVMYSCCSIGTMVHMEEPQTCTWVGDPHFLTFDKTRLDPTSMGKGVTSWVVNNPYVKIQSYYQGSGPNSPTWTRGVAVGGKFMRGHKLIIAKATGILGDGSPDYRQHLRTKVLFDGKEVATSSSYRLLGSGVVAIKKTGIQFLVDLPLGVQLRMNEYPYYFDNFLHMGRPPGGQEGQCGSNNFDGGDDQRRNLESSKKFLVSKNENLFKRTSTGVGTVLPSKKLKDCKGVRRASAERLCKNQFIGGDHEQDFIDMCTYDECFSTDQTAASHDLIAEQELKHIFELETVRTFAFTAKATTYAQAKVACGEGQEIYKVQSKVEHDSVVEALAAAKGITTEVWLGGEWQVGKWKWHDGAEICAKGFTYWMSGHGASSSSRPLSPYICMDRLTGRWKQCSSTTAGRNVVCAIKKKYGVLNFVGPMGARQACGAGKQMAMPKSASESSRLRTSIKKDSDKTAVWLGGRYDSSLGWIWDDGTQICGYTNWDAGQPDMSKKDTHRLWLCLNPITGKWKTCWGYAKYHAVSCETQTLERACPEGTVSASELGLKAMSHYSSPFMNHCFYVGKAGEDCHKTCASQIGGMCDHVGLQLAAQTLEACKLITNDFGGITPASAVVSKLSMSTTGIGCSYVKRGSIVQVITDVETGKSPRCSDRPSNPKQHRICSCSSTDTLQYPKGHILMPNDFVRISGAGPEPNKDFIIVLDGKQRPASLLSGDSAESSSSSQVRLVGQRSHKRMIWQTLQGTSWSRAQTILFWPFTKCRAGGKRWFVDFRRGKDHYEVFVNGCRFPFMDRALLKNTEVNHMVAKSILGSKIMLLPHDIYDHTAPISYHTNNGCVKSPYSFTSQIVLIEFKMRMEKVSGWRCIYCEERPLIFGNNVMLHNGKLVFTISNNAPRSVIFSQKFMAMQTYNISLLYRTTARTIQLYMDHVLVETKHIQRAQKATLTKAQVGCWHDHRIVQGTIVGLTISPTRPSYVAKHGFCGDFKGCKSPYKLKEHAWHELCQGPECTAADVATCCAKIANCSSFKCPAGETHKAGAAGIPCAGATCWHTERHKCCANETNCLTFKCPAHYVLRKVANTTWCDGAGCTFEKDLDRCCEKVAICASYKCPTGWAPKANVQNVKCRHSPCSGHDKERCCGKLGTCSTFKCPDHYVHRSNASLTYCTDPHCGHDVAQFGGGTPFERCCVETGHCSSLKCPKGMVPRTQVLKTQDIYCSTLKCTSLDTHRCCMNRAKCDSYMCPTTQVHHALASTLLCSSYQCDSVVDGRRCCVPKGVCTAYKCPTNFVHRWNASFISCGDANCSMNGPTDYLKCCVEDKRCTSLVCPSGYIHKRNASEIHCPGGKCLAMMHTDTCCNPTGRCNGYICPFGKALKADAPTRHCLDVLCKDVDADTCCENAGRCSTYMCPSGSALKVDAARRVCKSRTCSDTDFTHCCASKAICSTFTCPFGWVSRPDADNVSCSGWTCGTQDLNLCCRKRESCAGFRCPYHSVEKDDARQLLCQREVCHRHDAGSCCQKSGHCASFQCPAYYTHRWNATRILCDDPQCAKTSFTKCCVQEASCTAYECPYGYTHRPASANLKCQSHKCSILDRDQCCHPRATCNEMKCPEGKVQRANAAHRLCKGTLCLKWDTQTCCEKKGMCSTFKCPPGYAHSADKDQLLCEDATCKNSDYKRCCAEASTCATYKCPKDYILRADPATKLCHGWKCTDYDLTTCCDRKESCGSYDCPAGMVPSPHAQHLTCQGSHCSDLDLHRCCTEKGRCDTYKCPPDYLHRHNARSIFCDNHTCSSTAYETCCVKGTSCSGFQCPLPDYVLRADHASVFCPGWQCTDADLTTCCDRTTTCANEKCPSPLVLRLDAPSIKCHSQTCDLRDKAECCTYPGSCASFECPTDYLHVHNALHVHCKSMNCSAEDYRHCCATKNRCDTMHCPHDMVLRPQASQLFCRDFMCFSEDVSLCCESRAKCDEHTCPYGMTVRKSAGNYLCQGKRCGRVDDGHCCVNQGTCEKYQCPAGLGPKPNASEILCGDEDCNLGATGICCEPLATCCSYACPPSFVPRDGDCSRLLCNGTKCGYTDRFTCCTHRARCSSYHCPAHFRHRPKFFELTCKGSVCKDEDLYTCCTREDRCSALECPIGTAHRSDAHKIVCSDRSCDATDIPRCCAAERSCLTYACPYGLTWKNGSVGTLGVCATAPCTGNDDATCCGMAATCQTYKCPSGYQQRPNPAFIFCDGLTCTHEADLRKCCAKIGTCSTYECKPPSARRYDAAAIKCKNGFCGTTAEFTCCVKANNCDSYACPTDFSRKPEGVAESACRSSTCSDADLGTCCSINAPCTNVKCREGYAPRVDYMHRRCLSTNCTELDEEHCCQQKAICASFTCPSPWWRRTGNSYCAGPICRDTDIHRCCVAPQRCPESICPSNMTLRGGNYTYCTGERCGDSDVDTCCTPRAKCGTYTCPAGYTPASPDTLCLFETCKYADEPTCCNNQTSVQSTTQDGEAQIGSAHWGGAPGSEASDQTTLPPAPYDGGSGDGGSAAGDNASSSGSGSGASTESEGGDTIQTSPLDAQGGAAHTHVKSSSIRVSSAGSDQGGNNASGSSTPDAASGSSTPDAADGKGSSDNDTIGDNSGSSGAQHRSMVVSRSALALASIVAFVAG